MDKYLTWPSFFSSFIGFLVVFFGKTTKQHGFASLASLAFFESTAKLASREASFSRSELLAKRDHTTSLWHTFSRKAKKRFYFFVPYFSIFYALNFFFLYYFSSLFYFFWLFLLFFLCIFFFSGVPCSRKIVEWQSEY